MLRRRFLFNKVVEEKPVYTYTYTTTDGEKLEGLSGVKNHTYENGIGTFDNYSTTCVKFGSQNTLESVIIPEGITSIGDETFDDCTELINIEIPNSVTRIGWRAFWGCDKLTSIVIGNGVTSIEDEAFYWCPGLESIVVDPNNTKYDSRDNCNAIIETATNTLITGCQNTIIPNSVTNIGDNAFEGCSELTNIIIPNGVTYIGYGAFSNSGLTSVTIGNSVTSIEDHAFGLCTGLKTVYNFSNLHFSMNDRYYNGQITLYANKFFNAPNGFIDGDLVWFENEEGMVLASYLGNESKLILPTKYNGKNVVEIGDYAFYNCNELVSITIPENVTHINSNCPFYNCNSLKEIICLATSAPTITFYRCFENIGRNGVLKIPEGSDYSTWMKTGTYYLGYYNWTIETL